MDQKRLTGVKRKRGTETKPSFSKIRKLNNSKPLPITNRSFGKENRRNTVAFSSPYLRSQKPIPSGTFLIGRTIPLSSSSSNIVSSRPVRAKKRKTKRGGKRSFEDLGYDERKPRFNNVSTFSTYEDWDEQPIYSSERKGRCPNCVLKKAERCAEEINCFKLVNITRVNDYFTQFLIVSDRSNEYTPYFVDFAPISRCTCPDYRKNCSICKHMCFVFRYILGMDLSAYSKDAKFWYKRRFPKEGVKGILDRFWKKRVIRKVNVLDEKRTKLMLKKCFHEDFDQRIYDKQTIEKIKKNDNKDLYAPKYKGKRRRR